MDLDSIDVFVGSGQVARDSNLLLRFVMVWTTTVTEMSITARSVRTASLVRMVSVPISVAMVSVPKAKSVVMAVVMEKQLVKM